MSSYGDAFDIIGFENIIRDGYYDTPASGTRPQGATSTRTGVGLLYDSQGVIGHAAVTDVLSNNSGVAIYEHLLNTGNYLQNPWNQVIPVGVRVVLVRGPGVKLKIKQAGTWAVEDKLGPNGSGGWQAAASNPVWGYIERVIAADTFVLRLAE